MNTDTSLFWHRRDLRLNDNSGLFKALTKSTIVIPVFVFDKNILEKLEHNDSRVSFIYEQIFHIKMEYQKHGSDLLVYFGDPIDIIPKIAEKNNCSKVYTNRDYEPYAIHRDKIIYEKLSHLNIEFLGSKDHVIYEKNEVLKDNGTPYLVFTPYSKKWKSIFKKNYEPFFYSMSHLNKLAKVDEQQGLIGLKEMGFEQMHPYIPNKKISASILKSYEKSRNFPDQDGTSRLGVHLRFGTISIREIVNQSLYLSETYINELIWRDFYQMIIYHFPHSAINSFRKEYD